MASNSDSTSTIELEDSAGFEFTDLGSCSYLDPRSDDSFPTPARATTGSLNAASSDRTPPRSEPPRSPPTMSVESSHTAVDESARATALAPVLSDRPDAWGVSASHITDDSELDHPTLAEFPDPGGPGEPSADAAARLPEASASGDAADRLDEALADFLGGPLSSRSAQDELERLYGGVFDPEERAREATRAELDRVSTAAQVVPPPEDSGFAWDVDELDAPIDPDEIRRRVGSRGHAAAGSGAHRPARPNRSPSESDRGAEGGEDDAAD